MHKGFDSVACSRLAQLAFNSLIQGGQVITVDIPGIKKDTGRSLFNHRSLVANSTRKDDWKSATPVFAHFYGRKISFPPSRFVRGKGKIAHTKIVIDGIVWHEPDEVLVRRNISAGKMLHDPLMSIRRSQDDEKEIRKVAESPFIKVKTFVFEIEPAESSRVNPDNSGFRHLELLSHAT